MSMMKPTHLMVRPTLCYHPNHTHTSKSIETTEVNETTEIRVNDHATKIPVPVPPISDRELVVVGMLVSLALGPTCAVGLCVCKEMCLPEAEEFGELGGLGEIALDTTL